MLLNKADTEDKPVVSRGKLMEVIAEAVLAEHRRSEEEPEIDATYLQSLVNDERPRMRAIERLIALVDRMRIRDAEYGCGFYNDDEWHTCYEESKILASVLATNGRKEK